MYSSFRTARLTTSAGSRLDLPVAYSSCVCRSANVLITPQCTLSRDACQEAVPPPSCPPPIPTQPPSRPGGRDARRRCCAGLGGCPFLFPAGGASLTPRSRVPPPGVV